MYTDGRLLLQKYNWKGLLSNGYINSVFGKKGCKIATDDYGYRAIDGDIWAYTGVTSVNGDQSNIAFVLMNMRTSESKYYTVSGANEQSAMKSGRGTGAEPQVFCGISGSDQCKRRADICHDSEG